MGPWWYVVIHGESVAHPCCVRGVLSWSVVSRGNRRMSDVPVWCRSFTEPLQTDYDTFRTMLDPSRIHHVSSWMKTCSRSTPSHPAHFKQFRMSGAASGSYPSHPGLGCFNMDYNDPVPIGYHSFLSHPGSQSGVGRGDPGVGVTLA